MEVAVIENNKTRIVRDRAARMILWLVENQELINSEERGRLHFFFAGDSLKAEIDILREA